MKRIAVVIMTLSCVAVLAASCQPKVFEGNPASTATPIPPAPGYYATYPDMLTKEAAAQDTKGYPTPGTPIVLTAELGSIKKESPASRPTLETPQLGVSCSGTLTWNDGQPTLSNSKGQYELADVFGVLKRLRKELGDGPIAVTVQDSRSSSCVHGGYPVLRVFGLDPRLPQGYAYSPGSFDVSTSTGGLAEKSDHFWLLTSSEGGITRIEVVYDPCHLLVEGELVSVDGEFDEAGLLDVKKTHPFQAVGPERSCP